MLNEYWKKYTKQNQGVKIDCHPYDPVLKYFFLRMTYLTHRSQHFRQNKPQNKATVAY